jgi:hypothetical protein
MNNTIKFFKEDEIKENGINEEILDQSKNEKMEKRKKFQKTSK